MFVFLLFVIYLGFEILNLVLMNIGAWVFIRIILCEFIWRIKKKKNVRECEEA